MARLTLHKVLASVFGSDSDNFGHLESESEEEEDEGVCAYPCRQLFGLEKLAALSQVVSTDMALMAVRGLMYNSVFLLYKKKYRINILLHLSWNMAMLFHSQAVFSLACGSCKYCCFCS